LSTRYRSYALCLLTGILAFNYVDRFALGVLAQDIKVSLHLSDTELGLLTGIVFAAFYAVMGIPIARWADRGNRVHVISLTVATWGAAVAACGLAANVVQFALLRMTVAVGEAGCYPPSLSLISDLFGRAERPKAISLFLLGSPIALTVGYFAAGWLDQYFGWRTTFILIGSAGAPLALLVILTLREPRRSPQIPGSTAEPAPIGEAALPFGEVIAHLWRNQAYRNLFLSFSVWGFFGYGILQWLPAYFERSYHLTGGALGTWLAIIDGGAALLGTWLGGELAFRYAAQNERLQLAALAFLYGSLSIFGLATYLAPNAGLALTALGISAFVGGLTNGPIFSATQTLVPPRMRAMSISLLYLFCNLVGMGLGPLAVGALSDALHASFGKESLRIALVVFCPGYIWCAWHVWLASRSVTADIEASSVQADLAADPSIVKQQPRSEMRS